MARPILQIKPVNNAEQRRQQANRALALVQGLASDVSATLPAIDPDLNGRIFVRNDGGGSYSLHVQDGGAWHLVT